MDNIEWNLSDPVQARDFLKNVRMGEQGNQITYLQQEDGTRVSIDDASDEQVFQVVEMVAKAMNLAAKSKFKVLK
jgi:hypothetical protein